jgi:hypothetical protein
MVARSPGGRLARLAPIALGIIYLSAGPRSASIRLTFSKPADKAILVDRERRIAAMENREDGLRGAGHPAGGKAGAPIKKQADPASADR